MTQQPMNGQWTALSVILDAEVEHSLRLNALQDYFEVLGISDISELTEGRGKPPPEDAEFLASQLGFDVEVSANGLDDISSPEIAGEVVFEHPTYFAELFVPENLLAAVAMRTYDTSNGTIIPPSEISPEYAEFNRTHAVIRRQDRETMVLIDSNGHERVQSMKTIQMYTKYNQYGNNPTVDQQFVPFEPAGYLEFALTNNSRDGSGYHWGTYDYQRGCFNFVTKGRIATLIDMQARDVDITPPPPEGMVLVRESDIQDGRDAIIGRDRARRRAEQRQRDAAFAVNAPEIQAMRLEKQRQLPQQQLEKSAESATGAGGSSSGDGAPSAGEDGIFMQE
ncbi:hypothetical protein B0H11DRAFT_2272188 [Mycena galericulata]|nr:hypothetical protein B0H11DRAFT_2272188 [Mycena galericulata]